VNIIIIYAARNNQGYVNCDIGSHKNKKLIKVVLGSDIISEKAIKLRTTETKEKNTAITASGICGLLK